MSLRDGFALLARHEVRARKIPHPLCSSPAGRWGSPLGVATGEADPGVPRRDVEPLDRPEGRL